MSRRSGVWAIVLGLGAVVALALLLRAVVAGDALPLFADSDDAMHMVTATSLADGQPWYDTASHRENTPFGAPMHFSRLVDAPLAALLLLLRPLAGPAAGDLVALLYPALLLPLLVLVAFLLARRLVPETNPIVGAVVPLLSVVVLAEFSPGRVDHHNVQMLLTAGLALATIAGRTDLRAALAAGALAALSIGVGAETFHLVALAIAVFGLCWVFGAAAPRQVAGFAASLAATSLLVFATTIPPAEWLMPACDAFSLSYLVALLAGALALAVAAALGPLLKGAPARFAVLAVLGAAAGAATLLVSPQCLAGPYAAIDPALMKAFLVTVSDAHGAWYNFVRRPAETFTIVGIPLLEFAIGLVILGRARGAARLDWLVLMAFLALALAVSLVQLRGARLAVLYGVPVAVQVIELARRRYAARGGAAALLVFALSFLPFAGLVQLPLGLALTRVLPLPEVGEGGTVAAAPGGDRIACTRRGSFAALAALPPARVIAPMTLAADVLYFTPHSVVGTGFHRDAEGMADNMAFFSDGEAAARRIAVRRGLDYMALCGVYEAPGPEGIAPDSLSAGARYSWLTPLSAPDAPLQLYRIGLPAP